MWHFQIQLVLVVMSAITKELEKHVIKKLHMCTEYLIWIEWNLSKELHITTVNFWAQIFLNLHFNRRKMYTILYLRVKKWFGSIFQIFSQRCSSESTSSILDTLYVVNKEDPIKIFFLERLTLQIIKQQSKTHFIWKIAYCVWIYSFG